MSGPGQQQNPKAQIKKQSSKFKIIYLQKHKKKLLQGKKKNHQTHDQLKVQTEDECIEEKNKSKREKTEHRANRGNN